MPTTTTIVSVPADGTWIALSTDNVNVLVEVQNRGALEVYIGATLSPPADDADPFVNPKGVRIGSPDLGLGPVFTGSSLGASMSVWGRSLTGNIVRCGVVAGDGT